jgi:hypothetical protein
MSSHAERGVMPFSVRYELSRLPKRFPVGSAFVVEGQGRHGSMIPKPGRVRSRNDMRG